MTITVKNLKVNTWGTGFSLQFKIIERSPRKKDNTLFFKDSFRVAWIGATAFQVVLLCACKQETSLIPPSQFLQTKSGLPGAKPNSTPTSTPTPGPSLGPVFVPKIDASCMAPGNDYEACIFFKNPVYERKAPFATTIGQTSDLSQYQTYGVKIANRDTSGFLQNATFRVIPPNTISRLAADAAGKFKVPFSNCSAPGVCTADSSRRVSQVMAYYWLDAQEQMMKARTGKFYASGKNILVNTYQTNFDNAAWDALNNRVLMGVSGTQDYALSAEVYSHEMGHANLDYATNFVIFNSDVSGTEVVCAQGLATCCKTVAGCIDAINEGQADYHAAIVFDEGGTLGETLINTLGGIVECGLGR